MVILIFVHLQNKHLTPILNCIHSTEIAFAYVLVHFSKMLILILIEIYLDKIDGAIETLIWIFLVFERIFCKRLSIEGSPLYHGKFSICYFIGFSICMFVRKLSNIPSSRTLWSGHHVQCPFSIYELQSIQKMSLKGERKQKHLFSKGFRNLLRKNLQFKKKCTRYMYVFWILYKI